MKSEKIMNVFFYIFNTVSVFCFCCVLVKFFHIPNWILMLVLSFYALTYYCHTEIKKYILETHYVERNSKNVTNDFLENNIRKMGYTNYKIEDEINIHNYSEEQIKQALKSYYYN